MAARNPNAVVGSTQAVTHPKDPDPVAPWFAPSPPPPVQTVAAVAEEGDDEDEEDEGVIL